MRLVCKFLALFLSVAILICAVGCEEKEKDQEKEALLPFGLEIGDTYEITQNKIDIGELSDSDANGGYVSEMKYIFEAEKITEMLGTIDGVYNVSIALAFNADKKLYEYYCFFKAENDKLSAINDVIRQKYSKIAGEEEEEPAGIALWMNDKYSIDYRCTNRYESILGEDAICSITIHSFELDFE